MITDDSWNRQQVSAYSNLLHLKVSKILLADVKFNGNKYDRNQYFESISHTGDLFIDPDTGVSISKNDSKHINVSEIKALLKDDRAILIYQHKWQGEQFSKTIKKIVGEVRSEMKKIGVAAYDCGNVAMLFMSYDKGRIIKIADYFEEILAGDRVSCDNDRKPRNRLTIW